MPQRRITLDTIGDLVANGYTLHACCEARTCQRVERLDLDRLIRERGAGTPVDALKGRLRCSACGSRETSVRIIWDLPAGG